MAGVRAVNAHDPLFDDETPFDEPAQGERIDAVFLAEHTRRERLLRVARAHRLSMPLREGRAFVAVGADHLYGRDGILELIEREGYRVERIY